MSDSPVNDQRAISTPTDAMLDWVCGFTGIDRRRIASDAAPRGSMPPDLDALAEEVFRQVETDISQNTERNGQPEL